MTDPEPTLKSLPLAEVIGGTLLLALAGLLACGVWFLIDDAVGDWSEAYGPQSSDQPQPSWFYAFRQTGGFLWLLFFLPSLVLGIPGYLMLRAAVRHFHASVSPNARNA